MQNKLAVFLIVTVSFAAIFSSVTFYILSPRASQSFMSFGVYSQKGLGDYLPASNSTVRPGQMSNWTLSITNEMGSAQLVMMLVRIGNSSIISANSTTPSTCFPSANSTTPATCFPIVTAIGRFTGDGDTSNINFTWTIQTITNQTGRFLLNLQVNGASFSSAPVGAISGKSFRWIFELWTFDSGCGDPLSTDCFHYGYGPQTSAAGEWLQVWFNVST